jgi:hypothetical protein
MSGYVNPYVNPYRRAPKVPPTGAAVGGVSQANNMGPQSQWRLSLQQRTHRMQSDSDRSKKRLKKGDQQTLDGQRAFDPLKDCTVCRERQYGKESHKGHHQLCSNNRRTKGITSETTRDAIAESERLRKHFTKPMTSQEKYSSSNCTQEAVAAFFEPKPAAKKLSSKIMKSTATSNITPPPSGINLCNEVTAKMSNDAFIQAHKNNRAPLAMLALAAVVVDKIIRPNNGVLVKNYFRNLSFTVPADDNSTSSPHYHSIIGQKLLLVDWGRMFGVEIPCPCCGKAALSNDRTNFSKNRILFPIFTLAGAPMWCMVMSMTCSNCEARYNANDSTVLCRLPAYAMHAYPVDVRFTVGNRNTHIAKDATDAFDLLLPTYGNGDLCS